MELPQTRLAAISAAPMTLRPLPHGVALGAGGVVQPLLDSPPRVIVATAHADVIVDARSGRTLTTLPEKVRGVSTASGFAALGGTALFRLADGRVVQPKLEIAGVPLHGVELFAEPEHPRVLAIARGPDGAMFAGLVSPDGTTANLQPAPFDPSAFRYDRGENGFGDWELVTMAKSRYGPAYGNEAPAYGVAGAFPHGDACVRAAVHADGSVACREYAAPTGTDVHETKWLDGGYYLSSVYTTRANGKGTDFIAGVSNIGWGAQELIWDSLLGGTGCLPMTSSAAPPRALIECGGGPFAAVWTGDALFTFPASKERHSGSSSTDGDIIPFGDKETVERLVDLSEPRLFVTGEPLHPIAVAAFAGIGHLALAEAPSRPGEHDVRLIDFAKATVTPVARITDCDGDLEEEQTAEGQNPTRWLVLTCVKPYGGGRYGGTVQWSELVDAQTRVRYRTKSLVEGILASGLAIISDRRDVAAETRHTSTTISAIDLTKP